jgi:hypothetical protein
MYVIYFLPMELAMIVLTGDRPSFAATELTEENSHVMH